MNIKHMGWNLARKDLKVIEMPGNHFTMLKYPNVIEVAKEVKKLL
jgi:thioesterase domain-containing protein